jgi:hypothetical protein
MTETAPTAEVLAKKLDEIGLSLLAKRARNNEFHDYLTPHAFPEMVLVDALARSASNLPGMSAAIMKVRQDVIDGKYDASKEESDAWAASPEGQATFSKLTGRMGRKGPPKI